MQPEAELHFNGCKLIEMLVKLNTLLQNAPINARKSRTVQSTEIKFIIANASNFDIGKLQKYCNPCSYATQISKLNITLLEKVFWNFSQIYFD